MKPGWPVASHVPPMLLPFTVRQMPLKNRIVVSPMATYSAVDGLVQDFHLVHLGARALGGAGLVMVEMTSPTPQGRITPACTGLWNDAQMAGFKRIVDFVHGQSSARIGIQLGHSGPKGSTQVGWEAADEPLLAGGAHANWPLMAASAVAYGEQNQVPRAMTREEMTQLTQQFVIATRRAADAGFDWLELHCAHGYLLSSFICPLTNLRTDDYGGSIENRCRYPLEVFVAMRAAWPAHLPMSVRISAHDWAPGGNTADDAVTGGAPVQAGRLRHDRRLQRPDHARRQAGLWPHVPDAVFGPHPQRGRHCHHRRGRHQRGRPCQQHHRRRPRRPVRDRAPAPGRPGLDAA